MRVTKRLGILILLVLYATISNAYYTTNGKDIIDRESGEKVILKGIGLGGWLLPEGYMWGIRNYDRPWQFEKAISDLIGDKDAQQFWRIYRDNYVKEEDIAVMKEWGINTLRIPILASLLQPADGQPTKPPYMYSEDGFRYLDSIVKWCNKYRIGVIWDMHGAPGAQNEENISNSDGQARLWTEKEKYFPRCIDLWYKIAERYKDQKCIAGYDLLNEPLLKRYPYVDRTLLRKIYIQITDTIRSIDKSGIVFIEGDDWAQTFEILEPLDWDSHMVIAFHSYPPTSDRESLKYWDGLRNKYNIPLWHGETGEQWPPYQINAKTTTFLDSVNVGWAWWTHKKMEMRSQPWVIPRTSGFQKILDYWSGNGPRPTMDEAREWLFDQASKTDIRYCEFLPDMVKSLVPLDPEKYLDNLKDFPPVIINQPGNIQAFNDQPVYFSVTAAGNHLKYQWFKNDTKIEGSVSSSMRWNINKSDSAGKFYVEVSNPAGTIKSEVVRINIVAFDGPVIQKTNVAPVVDGNIDEVWNKVPQLNISKLVEGSKTKNHETSAYFKVLYSDSTLFLLISVLDDTLVNSFREPYKNDCIGIYLDPENNKFERYSGGEYMMMIVRGKQNLIEARGKPRGVITINQLDSKTGYTAELSIPWSSIRRYNKNGFMGLEIQIMDAFGKDRRNVLSWYSNRGDAYYSPLHFGVVKMGD
jgi:endoglucanase